MDADGCNWEKSGTSWTRYCNNFRHDHYHPADNPAGGPDPSYSGERRVTSKYYQDDGSEGRVEDPGTENAKDETTDRA